MLQKQNHKRSYEEIPGKQQSSFRTLVGKGHNEMAISFISDLWHSKFK